jgi:hypothetical protein
MQDFDNCFSSTKNPAHGLQSIPPLQPLQIYRAFCFVLRSLFLRAAQLGARFGRAFGAPHSFNVRSQKVSAGEIAVLVILVALVSYSICVTGYKKTASIAYFPHYREVSEEKNSPWKGLTIILGWMAICAYLAMSGYDVLTAIFWSGSCVAFLAWRLYPRFFNRKCSSCGSPMETFREIGGLVGPMTNFLHVCHTCQTVRKDMVFDVVDS